MGGCWLELVHSYQYGRLLASRFPRPTDQRWEWRPNYDGLSFLDVATTLSSFRDYQEIKIQEQVQKLDIGQISSKDMKVCK